RLGAGRTGQLLAALAAATCAEYLGAMHELTTTTPDLVFWALILLLVMQLLASRDPRWWLAIGYLLIGALIAAVLAAPDVVWQAAHGWPGLDVFRVLQTAAGHNRIVYW